MRFFITFVFLCVVSSGYLTSYAHYHDAWYYGATLFQTVCFVIVFIASLIYAAEKGKL